MNMKQHFNLSITSPCSEDFENFQATETGGFCSSCQKNVVDFTQMNEEEILQYFKNNTGKTCGKFKPRQLKTYTLSSTPPRRYGLQWIGTGFIGLSLLFANNDSMAQSQSSPPMPVETHSNENTNKSNSEEYSQPTSHTITGQVINEEDREPLPGVSIIVKGTTKGAITDINGRFKMSDIEDGLVLQFSYIGYSTIEHEVSGQSTIDISMEKDQVELMGDVVVEGVYTSKPSFWQRIKRAFQ
ncbi:carboxypeptidase-like regulatory domain-containing protein [Rapidithrix thailandica]|uniref:Carboxypeptidase-like regulatory domain-containing protein n=1 Tax=Rapidithrix thailandica TaxID=413964 RepID=A0AAW9RNH5_9BACT